jgi:hypothetical protein
MNGRTAMRLEDCVGGAKGCEDNLRSSSVRITAASRQAAYSSARQLSKKGGMEPIAASAEAMLPLYASKEKKR